MKKKMMAILMATLMLGALFAVPAVAEDATTFSYYEPFNADFTGTAVTVITSVPDPTTPEGETPTNYCLPVKAKAVERQQPCMTMDIRDENNKAVPFSSGLYKLSYRAYCTKEMVAPIALYTVGGLSYGSNYPYRLFMNYATGPKTKAGEWTDFSIVFYLPETLEKDGVATKTTCLMLNLDNAQASASLYYDDIKLEKMEDAFFYVKDTTYTSYAPTASSKDNLYYNGAIVQEEVLGISRGAETTALTGAAEKIRPVFLERSAKLGDELTVIHAVYEMENGKKSLYAVEITEATKNLRNVLISEDKEIDIPAKTADKTYELKSFIWDSVSGLTPLGGVSTLSLAQTE